MRQLMLRSSEAAVIMLFHTMLGGVTVTCMWALEFLLEFLGRGQSVLIYNRWPLEYLFQTIDVAIALTVGVFGLWETIEVLSRRSK